MWKTLSLLALSSLQAPSLWAADLISKDFGPKSREIKESIPLDAPTSFEIDNSEGRIDIYESKDSSVEISGVHEGDGSSHLQIERMSPRAIRVKIVSTADVHTIEGDSDGIRIEGIPGMSGVVIGRTTNVSGMNISHSVINTGSGSITIGGSARGMVIRTGQDTQVTYSRGGSVALRIGLPSSLLMDLSVKSKQGEVRIAGKFDNEHKDGRGVSVLAGSGSIECQGICAIGQIELRTSSGDVAAEAVDGSLKVVSEHGKIRLTGNRGAIQVEGNMTGVIADANEGDITVETRMGNVEITRQSHGKIDVKTGMGDIHLKALAPTATEGNIETRMGEVHRDTPVRANPHRPDPSAHRRRDTRW